MKALTAAQRDEKAKLLTALQETHAAANAAIRKYNAEVEHLWEDVERAVEAAANAVVDANEFMTEVADAIEDSLADRSETWRESAIGQRVEQWQSEWQNEIEEVEVFAPDSLEEIDADSGPMLFEELPEEA